MSQTWFLTVTAWVEMGAGLSFLLLPSIPFELLLGMKPAVPEGDLIARVLGAALLAIAIASWAVRAGRGSPAERGVIFGLLFYNVAVALLLAYAGCRFDRSGIALWPAVALHSALTIWGAVGLVNRSESTGGKLGATPR
jgi:hypothetical protein